MKSRPFARTLLVALFAASAALPTFSASAAIPCNELPVVEADPTMPVPMIFIELPVTVEGALTRGGEADRSTATPANDDAAGNVHMAAENQFRCLGYGMDVAFVGNSTPQQRVHMFARPNIEAEVEQYIKVESLDILSLGDVLVLEDGRYLVDFKILVDGDHYMEGELVFADVDGTLYLDGSAISDMADMNDEPIEVELSTRFTREVKLIHVANGDVVVFNNVEEESNADIVIADSNGETVFEGWAMAEGLVGGEDLNIFAVHNLEPGDYQVTVIFDENGDGIVYGATLVVSEGASATPVASPEASPES